ncbi:tetracycline resistance protein, class C-like isoform X2 [Ischnura elegans]|uniref:tetracycline resistance protein, class C-like isoform X2 n=1 Tax=Ischnura elegans TaxID=197161 RepID=UPI001ED8B2AC|nr:tetracycline resistance protein, class C-like isoform X2 [Ischnura elegans]
MKSYGTIEGTEDDVPKKLNTDEFGCGRKDGEQRRRFRMPGECWGRIKVINVEPILFFVSFSMVLSDAPFQDLVLKRICLETPGIEPDVCESLPQHPKEEEMVQPRAVILLMAKSLIEAILPALMAFWVGPWSDRTRRRKPLLVLPLVGYALRYAILAILVGFTSVRPEYFLIASVPIAVSGGLVSTFTSLTCIVGDETEGDGPTRTLRLGLLQAFFIVGILPASLMSSSVLSALGYHGVFAISGLALLLALVITLFIVKDTPPVRDPDDKGDQQTVGLVKEMFQTVFKERPNGGRACIILCVLALASSIITYEGESSLGFLYVREKFGWKIKEFTLYLSATIALYLFGTVFGVVILSNKLKIPDATLTASVYLTKVISSLVRAFASEPWMMYLSSVIAVFGDISSPVSRSILSKNAPQDELGKVFSLTASLEALTPLASSPLYTLLYNKTLHTFPGAYFILSAGIFFFDFILLSIVGLIQLKHSRFRHVPLQNEAGCT